MGRERNHTLSQPRVLAFSRVQYEEVSSLSPATSVYIVTCRAVARERLGKQPRNKYATNNRAGSFLGNARNTRTQQ
jgi:hypothetical protein